MIRIGRNLRDLDCPFNDEVTFSYKTKFDIIQVWYNRGKIDALYELNPIKILKKSPIKSIVHALFDINDFDCYEDDLINKLIELNHEELILHPVIKTVDINKKSIKELEEKVLKLLHKLDKLNIRVYIENNHNDMQCFYTPEQWKKFFKKAPKNTEFLIDIVHVLYNDDYDLLKKLISVKRPKALHIADTIKGKVGKKHLHLPIGDGMINFEKIFNEILPNYDDLIILEIKNTDEKILHSKKVLENILKK